MTEAGVNPQMISAVNDLAVLRHMHVAPNATATWRTFFVAVALAPGGT